ncbi:MAG: adenylate/guanylate cyclase domain-containing protein [Actinomycetota bacterium]|nr:adenylate/guanylate cyclase domain-containing protein [Actinomycetota bacterium]
MKTGTVTLLFTDLVGSSELIQRLGDDAADRVRRRYFSLLRNSVQYCGGDEVKSLGDGLMVVFPSAVDAVSCAVAMQQSIHEHNSEHEDEGLRLRVGLHAGEPVREGDDFFGQSVVVAKRICDGAQGGQIVTSELVQSIVGSRGEFEWKELGWVALKGVATPVSCSELVWRPAPIGSSPPIQAEADERSTRTLSLASPRLQGAVAAGVTLGLVLAGIFAVNSELDRQTSPQTLTWAEVEPFSAGLGGPGNQRINRLLSSQEGVIAVGEDASSGRPDAAVWTSENGTVWSRRAREALAEPGGQGMLGVTAGGPGFVAVGYRGNGETLDAAVWTSEDGREWTLVQGDPGLGGARNEVMNRVARSDFGLVAVGYQGLRGDRDAAAWVSVDGLTWDRAEVPEEQGDNGTQEMRGVAALGDDLVAVGEDGLAGNYDAAVWFSEDGRSWRRRAQPPEVLGGPGEQIMTSLVASDAGFVAVGWSTVRSDLDAQVWTSQDGMEWNDLSYDEAVFGGDGDQLLWGVELSRGTFIAVGRDDFGGGSDAAVWTSEDGLDWSRTPSDESVFGGDRGQEMKVVAAVESRLVGAGWDGGAGHKQDAAIWWAELPGR